MYKELSKALSQRSITELAFKINKHVPETVFDRQLPMNVVDNDVVQSMATEESDIQAMQHKRMWLLLETDNK
jgi:hypothetical protein